MRKTSATILMITVLALGASQLVAEEGAKWLDPANCHFCKPLTEPEGMMENLTWENHNIANGTLSVVTYSPEWKEKYEAASAKIMALWQAFDPTKDYKLCGMCQAWMAVPFDKVSMESVKFEGGEISLTTTTDPEVLAQLHSITDKTNAEYEAMMKMQMGEGHEGHDH